MASKPMLRLGVLKSPATASNGRPSAAAARQISAIAPRKGSRDRNGLLLPSTTRSRNAPAPYAGRDAHRHAARQRHALFKPERPAGANRDAKPVRTSRIVFDADNVRAGADLADELLEPVSGRKLAQDDDIRVAFHDLGTLAGPRPLAVKRSTAPLTFHWSRVTSRIRGPVLADRAGTDHRNRGPGSAEQTQETQDESTARKCAALPRQCPERSPPIPPATRADT